LLPGLVNAHTHLELSWLRDRVPPANAFTSWVKQLIIARGGTVEHADDPVVLEAAAAAAREALETGTVAIGDISNSLASVSVLAAAGLHAVVFHELLGFKETSGALIERTAVDRAAARDRAGARVRLSLAPHAPYSVSPELFRAVREAVSASAEPRTSVHVGESPEEMELLATGTGEWVRMLRWIGAWREDWMPPASGPVEYLDGLGVIDDRTLVVHGVQLSDASLGLLRERGATLVTCPRSNQWVGVGVPPVERFYRAGVPVAVGTDSLASVADLNLFEELKVMRWLGPAVPARCLLESATLVGARALGLQGELGSLTPGKRADVVQVEVPARVTDVEEYLVSGIPAAAIDWASTTR
jgi:cytosine/adenosine deaminase-related metal-dependent hydrolase